MHESDNNHVFMGMDDDGYDFDLNADSLNLDFCPWGYFDPDDFGQVDYSRPEYFLTNRGSDFTVIVNDEDAESFLFGTVDESDTEDGLVAPPDMTFVDDYTEIFVHNATLNLRELPTSSSPVLHQFKLGDNMLRTGIGPLWSRVETQDGLLGFVYNEYTDPIKPTPTPTPTPRPTQVPVYQGSPAKASSIGGSVALEVQKYLGVRYVWANANPNVGFDCSGLTWYVFNRYGIDTPRGTSTYRNSGTIVPYSNIQPGDVISWNTNSRRGANTVTHVGLYIGNGMMVHASSSNKKVVKVSVEQYRAWGQRLLQVHRFYGN